MKIVLITSGQPSLNPRLVKEADALSNAGYSVTVLYAYWNNWGTQFDETLLAKRKWKAKRIGGSPNNGRFIYIISRIIFKLSKTLRHPAFTISGNSRAAYPLIWAAKKHKADLYIAHNLGALPAAVIAAKKYNKPCGFDAEDFHRNETTDDPADSAVIRKSIIEDRFLPKLKYFTASSPLIAEAYRKLYPDLKPVVILNVFDKVDIKTQPLNRPIKLFWFSQTIGANRGLEDALDALEKLNEPGIELHLLGNRSTFSKSFTDGLMTTGANIVFHNPIPADDVVKFATQFDIGLALENHTPLNRDLCLTNKIFTYLQAGLAVIATDTSAQSAFMKENPRIGSIYYNKEVESLAQIFSNYHQHSEKLLACKEASLKLGQEKYNWETESKKFLNLVNQLL